MLSQVFRRSTTLAPSTSIRAFGSLAPNVHFEKVAREWRCKWDEKNDKKALQDCQSLLDEHLSKIKGTKGVLSVQRVVCGSCQDFKVVTKLVHEDFKGWAEGEFSPEKEFLGKLEKIDGVSGVETQTYTLEEM